MTSGCSDYPGIISTPSKPIATKELLARLQRIADELSGVDQSNADLSKYKQLVQDLSHSKLIQHRNVGIRAFACCALTDILRLYAPEAPLEDDDLSRIFKAFFDQFSHLWDAENPYYFQQCHILKCLVEVRSVILVTELPDAQELISYMFETMYEVAFKGLSASLEHLAAEMLAETISEADQIPLNVATLVVKKLTTHSASRLVNEASNITNTAFIFSLTVCQANADKMSRLVAQMFSEMLDDSVKSTENGDVDYASSFKALEKIHTSSINIWMHVPELLGSVLGLISDELNSDDDKIRCLATATVGQMLCSHSRSHAEIPAVTFVNNHKTAWVNWLKKFSDSSSAVRSKWLEQVPAILAQNTTSEIAMEICQGLSKCFRDSNEKVRFSACRAVEALPFDIVTSRVLTRHNVESLLLLIREKHSDIRNKAISVLADTYNSYMETILDEHIVDFGSLNNEEIHEIESLISRSIPSGILELNYINDILITSTVDVVLFEKLLPFLYDPEMQVARLCRLYSCLSERGRAVFDAISKRQKQYIDALISFTDLAEEFAAFSFNEIAEKENLGVLKNFDNLATRIDKLIQWLCASFPVSLNSYACFDALVKSKNIRLINLLKNCINSQLEYKTVKNSLKELLSKLGDPKAISMRGEKNSVTSSDMVSNMKILLYRSANIIFNKSNVKELLKLSQDPRAKYLSTADDLISQVSVFFPGTFKDHLESLSSIIMTTKGNDLKTSFLRSFYHFVKKFPESITDDADFREAVIYMSTTESPTKSKYCLKIIGCFEDKELVISRILGNILPLSVILPNFLVHLSVLAEVYKIDPQALAQHSKDINDVIIEQVLRKNRLTLSDVRESKQTSWIDDDELERHPLLLEKLVSLRLVVNRLRGSANMDTDKQYLIAAAEKPVKLLCSIITNNGEITKSAIATPAFYRLRLQLSSGYLLLKLAKMPEFSSLVDNSAIMKMGTLLHHELRDVRKGFATKLQKHLHQMDISDRFYPILFLMGHEPDASIKSSVQTWIASQHKHMAAKNNTLIEKSIVRLIYIIAHDDRFIGLVSDESDTTSQLKAYSYALKYVSMFLETIASDVNVSLLYYLASRVKQYRDASVEPSAYEDAVLVPSTLGIYRISELFQLSIKEMTDSKGWSIQTWPGKINLPSDLFSPMADYNEAQKFISKVYIPDDLQIELRRLLKKLPNHKPSATFQKPDSVKKTKTPRKKTAPQKKAASNKRAQAEPPVATRVSKRVKKQVNYEVSSESSESENDQASDSSFA